MVKKTCASETVDNVSQNIFELNNPQRQQISGGLISQKDIERNIQKSKEIIENQEEGLITKEIIQA